MEREGEEKSRRRVGEEMIEGEGGGEDGGGEGGEG